MGKKLKAKTKNPRKTQQQQQQREPAAALSDAGSGDAESQDAGNSTEEAAAASASGREQCGHYGGDIARLDKVLLEIMSSKHFASCEHCRDDMPRKKGGGGGKEKGGKQQKRKGGGQKGAAAKGQAKAQKSDMWVCLDCGRQFCGGEVDMTKPYGHARRHAKQDRHWWAARFDDPTVAFCLSCEKEVSIEMPRIETVAAVPAEAVAAVDRDLGLVNLHGSVIRGLPNLGNTCFFNAVMQSLLALDRLRSKMLGPDVPTGALSMSLKKLFMETSASNDVGGALSPKNLFSNICSKYPQFRGYQMQDSHELLRCFLDGLRTEENEAWKLADESSNAAIPTIVDSIFGGQLSSTVSSTECTHSSVKHDQFLDLSLPVPSRRPPAKSVSSPPAKRNKQSIRDRNKNRRYGRISPRVSPIVQVNNKEKIETVAECNDSQIPGSESGQVVCEKEPEPSECSESCASVPNLEQTGTSNVEDPACWLDYIDDADEAKSEILDSADSTEAGHIWEDKGVIHGPFLPQDYALSKEQVLGSEHSGENLIDDATSSHPIILLPYKEFGSTAEEMDATVENSQKPEDALAPPAVSLTEDNAQPASVGDGDQDDFAGLGDMFNEPEVTSEVKKETGTVENIDVMAWSSNSAEDEVDDSNAPVSVEGCLALFTEPELLSEPWHCEHCSNSVACPDANDGKHDEMATSANERKDGKEMMAGGDERQDGDKLITNCIEEEGTDQIMATDGCSDNLNTDMNSKEGGCANSSLAGAANSGDANFSDNGKVALLKSGASLVETEQADSKLHHLETQDLNNSALEYTSLSKQPRDSTQHKDENNVDVASEEATAPECCRDDESASCSTTNKNEAECGAGSEEIVASSLPSEMQRILPGERDNEDVITRNQGRRKRMKMVGKAHQGRDSQNEQKQNGKKVFRTAMRRILISKAPPVLTINLNRFSQDSHGRFKKLKGHVRFKEIIDVQPFMDPRSKENDNTTYRLVGVVEHLGTMAAGHYVAYVRTGKIGGRQQRSTDSKSWFYASDAQVREASLEEVLNCEAYILFYERVGD
ncbi:ubiquitin carboxyl-terminal hydrolase 2-like [Oryza brachyantha]|uniref:Ubiquitinyl hydrolase 1 n=1 Tax=Oryza brachyantha TaxID=4533 RepID=J3MYZ2_ORYBR|nr:ubiquitin carboxyl-terminal hydrolase 2-like [Oryza brachyantha]XP_015696826.1 ubiquitin carboxyl-terminal hydrolase 2-like [Oryza brachyantha]